MLQSWRERVIRLSRQPAMLQDLHKVGTKRDWAWNESMVHLEPCNFFSLTTMSLAMSLHAGMLASLTAEQVLLRTMLPMGRVMALASFMPCDEPEASTTASKACRAAADCQSYVN